MKRYEIGPVVDESRIQIFFIPNSENEVSLGDLVPLTDSEYSQAVKPGGHEGRVPDGDTSDVDDVKLVGKIEKIKSHTAERWERMAFWRKAGATVMGLSLLAGASFVGGNLSQYVVYGRALRDSPSVAGVAKDAVWSAISVSNKINDLLLPLLESEGGQE